MARPKTQVLTERESQIMEVLWDLGKATSEQVCKHLPGSPHDSSVRTLLRVLEKKKFVRVLSDQRPTQYRAAVPRAKAQKSAVKNLVERMFGGSAESLVVRLLEDKQLTVEQLDELRRSLAEPSSQSKKKASRSEKAPQRKKKGRKS